VPGEDDAFCGHVLSGDDDGTGVDDGSQMDLDDFGWIYMDLYNHLDCWPFFGYQGSSLW
jgi:hypothetical protein